MKPGTFRGFPNHIFEEQYKEACGKALDAYLQVHDLHFTATPELLELNEKLYEAYRAAVAAGESGDGLMEALDALEDAIGEVDVSLDPVNAKTDFQVGLSDSDVSDWTEAAVTVIEVWKNLVLCDRHIRSARLFPVPFLN